MPEAHKRSYRHPKYNTAYRVKNWAEYEKSLRDRGDITVWLSQDGIDAWTPEKTEKRGGQAIYSDVAIETEFTFRLVFHLPLRQPEGFVGSILKLMDLNLPVPDHTTLSRRNRSIEVRIVISQRSRAKVVSSGNANRGTICRVTRRTRYFVTRRFSEGI